jgi:hypothetical protein
MVSKTPHEWSKDSLLSKAQRYATKMLEQSREDWEFGFWSALCLEMIVRAAVAQTSPALLADGKDWTNLAFALGVTSSAGKLSPKSIDITEAAGRAQALHPAYTREMANFTALHVQRRNAELHSGVLAFDNLGTAWLPQFYAACEPLLKAAGSSLAIMFGTVEAATADTLIQALKDDAAKAVQGTINARRTIWEEKDEAERQALGEQAATLSARSAGHRVVCPACGSTALVHGTPAGANVVVMQDDYIVTKTPMLPAHFECKACALKITGFSKLNACGLGDTYTSTSWDDPMEYFGVEPEIRYVERPMDEDNNEP